MLKHKTYYKRHVSKKRGSKKKNNRKRCSDYAIKCKEFSANSERYSRESNSLKAIKCNKVKVSPKGNSKNFINDVWEYTLTIQQIVMPLLLNEVYPYVVSLQFFNAGSFFLEFFRDDPFVMKAKGFVFLLLKLLGTIIISIGTFGIPFYIKTHSSLILLYLINAVFYVSGVILDRNKINPIIEGIKSGKNVSVGDRLKLYITNHSWVVISLTVVTIMSLISLKLNHRI